MTGPAATNERGIMAQSLKNRADFAERKACRGDKFRRDTSAIDRAKTRDQLRQAAGVDRLPDIRHKLLIVM